MRLLLYSSFRLFAESLASSLGECEGVTVVRHCWRAEDLSAMALQMEADVVLVDVMRPNTLEQVRELNTIGSSARLVALAVPETLDDVIACADAGFSGFISPRASLDDLTLALKQTLNGECTCSPIVAAGLIREVQRRQPSLDTKEARDTLTLRECDILAQVAKGLSNKEIASALHLSVATVKNHLHNIFTKFRVRGRTEALALLRTQPWLARTA